jgi:hypothetical protein
VYIYTYSIALHYHHSIRIVRTSINGTYVLAIVIAVQLYAVVHAAVPGTAYSSTRSGRFF